MSCVLKTLGMMSGLSEAGVGIAGSGALAMDGMMAGTITLGRLTKRELQPLGYDSCSTAFRLDTMTEESGRYMRWLPLKPCDR